MSGIRVAPAYKPKPKVELVPELANGFTPLGYFGAGVVTLVKAVHDILLEDQPHHACQGDLDVFFDTWGSDFIEIKWPASLTNYFVLGEEIEDRHQLRRDNPGEKELATFLGKLIDTAIMSWKRLLELDDLSSTPLKFFQEIRGILEEGQFFNKKLKKLAFELSSSVETDPIKVVGVVGRRNTVKIEFSGLNFEEHNQKTSRTNLGTIRSKLLSFAKIFCEWAEASHGLSCELKGLPGLKLCDSMAWMHRVIGLDWHESAEINYSGFFQVVREARGAVTSDASDMNLILRDLLWIRSFSSALPDTAVEDRQYPPQRRQQAHGSPLGFYYSVLDSAIYEVKRLQVIGDVLNIEGIALFNDPHRSKPLNMNLPRFDNASHNFSMGTLMGATNERLRTGAWSVIGVRPEIDREVLAELDNIFCLYADALLLMERGKYNENISKFSDYVQSLGLAGVLASKALSDGDDGNRKSISVEMTEAFRGIFKTSKKHRTNCEAARDKLLNDLGEFDADRSNVSFASAEIGEAILELIEQQSSYAISPTKVFKRDLKKPEAEELQGIISTISQQRADLFNTYEDYRAWCDT